jgi:hypothetical protein
MFRELDRNEKRKQREKSLGRGGSRKEIETFLSQIKESARQATSQPRSREAPKQGDDEEKKELTT